MGSAPWASHVAADGTRDGREHRAGPRGGTYDRCAGHPGCRILRKRDGKESLMKFMLTFTLKPETKGRDEAIARFKKTGGQPLKVESDAAAALTEFALMWSDLMELRIVPVVEDAEISQVLHRASRRFAVKKFVLLAVSHAAAAAIGSALGI